MCLTGCQFLSPNCLRAYLWSCESKRVCMCVCGFGYCKWWLKMQAFPFTKIKQILWVYFCKINKILYHNFTNYLNFSLFARISKLKSWLVFFCRYVKRQSDYPRLPLTFAQVKLQHANKFFLFAETPYLAFFVVIKKTRREKRNRRKI